MRCGAHVWEAKGGSRDRPGGGASEVLWAFLALGCTAFGGPIAHIGYFRRAFVEKRGWLGEAEYADLVALCQFLPGPASSQVGFALGLRRAGPLGALAAWCGFTLPSALLMTLLGLSAGRLHGPLAAGLVHGLKLVAVAVVAQAILGMARSLTPDARRAGIALGAAILVTVASTALGQIAAIALGVIAGLFLCRQGAQPPPSTGGFGVSRPVALAAQGAFLLLLAASSALGRFGAVYRAGALVFGGGHVVLPLLKSALVDPGWMSSDAFLAGYGAAQAMPGPLFTIGAYLGAVMDGPNGAALALAALFLPGLLVLVAVLPFWQGLRARPGAQASMRGANAAVVGVLANALYDPVWTGAVLGRADFAAALTGFVLLAALRVPPIIVVALGILFGVVRGV